MNVQRMLELADYVEKNLREDQIDPDVFMRTPEHGDLSSFGIVEMIDAREPPCGTRGCLAGWTVTLFDDLCAELIMRHRLSLSQHPRTDWVAGDVLELDDDERHELFYGSWWNSSGSMRDNAVRRIREMANANR